MLTKGSSVRFAINVHNIYIHYIIESHTNHKVLFVVRHTANSRYTSIEESENCDTSDGNVCPLYRSNFPIYSYTHLPDFAFVHRLTVNLMFPIFAGIRYFS